MDKNNGYESALNYAVDYLGRFNRTEKQLRDKMLSKGFERTTVDAVIDKLKEYGYVSDESYAKSFVSSAVGKGKRRVVYELRQKGVAEAVAIDAAEALGDGKDEALRIAEKYMKSKQTDKRTLSALYRYLVGRGFETDVVSSVIRSFGVDREQ